MKVVKYLESWGIDLRKLAQSAQNSRTAWRHPSPTVLCRPTAARPSAGHHKTSRLPRHHCQYQQYPGKLDLTLTDVYEMLDDSGITIMDIMEVVNISQEHHLHETTPVAPSLNAL